MKGLHHSDETRQKMRAGWARRKAEGRPHPRVGAKLSLETRARISQRLRETAVRGEACHSYKDGRLAERRDQRLSIEYKRWRYDVYLRDGFACRHCGDDRGGNLHAHHVKAFADHPDLRLDVDNGITLCEPCHWALHRGEIEL